MRPGAFAAVGVGLAVVVSCGPSYQAVYEGNLRFEHCYRLDIESSQSTRYRERCWREWLKLYTYGQTRDRVDYASKRAAALESGAEAIAFDPSRSDGGAPVLAPTAPAPTSVSASPPPTASAHRDAGRPAESDGSPAPQDECVDTCRSVWRGCVDKCDQPKAPKNCKECGKDYRRCMKRCFR